MAVDDSRHAETAPAAGAREHERPRLSGAEDVEHATPPALIPSAEPWRSLLRWIGIGEQLVGATLLLVILVLVLAQVVQRYVPGAWPWTGEVARLSMVWATFVMAGYLAAHDQHIAIHVADYVLRGRALAVLKLIVNVAVLVTCLALIYATYQLVATDIGQVTAAAQLPLRFVNAVPIVGFGLVALRAVIAIALRDVPELVGRQTVAA